MKLTVNNIVDKLQTLSLKAQTKVLSALLISFPSLPALAAKGVGIGGIPVEIKGDASFTAHGNWLLVAKGYIGRGGLLIALAISVLGFVWVAYAALAKFNECRTGKAEWAELGILVIAAAAMLVFITLLLTQTKGIFGADPFKPFAK